MPARRIDFHAHCMPDAYRDAILASPIAPTARIPKWSYDAHVEMMERNAIALSVLALAPPGLYFGDAAVTKGAARRVNEAFAEIVARGRGRFRALAALPLPAADDACEEIAYALDVLGLDGVSLFASYAGQYLGRKSFDPVMAMLHERGALAFVHPNIHPANELIELAWPPFVIEYPFDTARAAVNLIFSGALDRYPDIRFVLAHGGGALPSLAYRISMVGSQQLAKPPYVEKFPLPFFTENAQATDPAFVMARVRRFWFECALSAGPTTLDAVRAIAEPGHILFGSDWPYAPEPILNDTIAQLDANPHLSAAERHGIAYDNAASLLGIGALAEVGAP